MQPNEKAGEPSMEDILASIRKIIAEDPSATPANGLAAAPAPQIPTPSVMPSLGFPTPSRAGDAPSGHPSSPAMSSLEQELADLLREPVEVPPAARPVPVPTAPPAVSPTNGTGAHTASASSSSGLTAWLRGKPKAEAPRPEPSMELSATARPESEITPFLPDAVAPHEAAISAMIAADPARPPAAVQQPVAAPTAPAPTLAAPRPKGPEVSSAEAPVSMQSILERLKPPATAAPGVVVTAPVPAAVRTRSFTASPAVSDRPVETSELPVAPANRLAAEPPIPAAEADAESVATAAPVAALAPARAEPAPASGNTSTEITPATVKAIAEPAPPETAKVVPDVISAPREAAPSPVASVAPAPALPTSQSTAAAEVTHAAPVPTPAASVQTVPSAPGPVLENMLAEAMRPMVRQWLDENMREALEKALRAEMSESLLSVLDKMKDGGKP